ncbi:hypothetical protein [Desulfurococcus mucosus]|uniref:Membrane protein-like protein n=1 Tax=Desulfurococcus mucosus (strain ATCC 35584 / DSM 2162 / JCM 9187 / O7/1) TaxID=765177 RepID=E8R8Y2_DESM0|nr:hypothetical protein [Desulfurococcus mucosus]ADV64958.1 membrane protein-like protein [Desulfurococcus mucosus DSM 2162]
MSAWRRELEESRRLVYVSGFTALAVVLRFFEIPFPLASFLKYDFSGVPLAVLGLMSLKWAFTALPVYYMASVIAGADPVGMVMKTLAELSTFTPLALSYRALAGRLQHERLYIAVGLLASVSRIIVMTLANLAVTPIWLMMAYPSVFNSYRAAYEYTLGYIPVIALFNATMSLIVVAATIPVYRVLERIGVLDEH